MGVCASSPSAGAVLSPGSPAGSDSSDSAATQRDFENGIDNSSLEIPADGGSPSHAPAGRRVSFSLPEQAGTSGPLQDSPSGEDSVSQLEAKAASSAHLSPADGGVGGGEGGESAPGDGNGDGGNVNGNGEGNTGGEGNSQPNGNGDSNGDAANNAEGQEATESPQSNEGATDEAAQEKPTETSEQGAGEAAEEAPPNAETSGTEGAADGEQAQETSGGGDAPLEAADQPTDGAAADTGGDGPSSADGDQG
ncbi:circumsporozoite protein-like [Amphibalanus amphitrite]|uniref:circumsporozoite protein-like n=1 Tax=Amphibalanus amphitrite TaxID=1232801 RepID=UPI001C9261AC|nr:circumsporozoite protein-like [Amphibalanus amphitrite]